MLADLIAEVLAEHRIGVYGHYWGCRCGLVGEYVGIDVAQRLADRHLAEETAAVVGTSVAGAVANVVREFPPGSVEQEAASRCYVAALGVAGIDNARTDTGAAWAVDHPGLGIYVYPTEEEARAAAGTAGTLLHWGKEVH